MRVIGFIFRFFLLLILLVELAILGGYYYLNSAQGLAMIATRGSAFASSDGQYIVISGLQGQLLRELRLGTLTIADTQGVWLELHDVRLVWQPRNLLRRQPPLEVVEAGQVILYRQPVPVAEAATAPNSAPSELPPLNQLAAYLPHQLAIHDIWIHPEVAGYEQRLSLAGNGDGARYQLQLNTLQGPRTSLEATLVPEAKTFSAQLAFSEAPGGIVGALANLPHETALSAMIDAQADLAGNIQLRPSTLQAGAITAQLQGSYALETEAVDALLQLDATDLSIPQALSGTAMSGSVRAAITAKGTPQAMSVSLHMTSPQLSVDGNRFGATDVTAEGNANITAIGKDDFTAALKLTAATIYNGTKTHVEMNADADSKQLTLHQWALTYGDMSGEGSLTAKGTPEQFDLTSENRFTTPYGPSTLHLNGNVDVAKQHYRGTAKGQFTYLKEAFELSSQLDADAALAKLEGFKLHGPGTDISGDVTVRIPEQLANGKLTINADDLAPLGRIARQPLAGALHATVDLSASGAKQAATIIAKADKLHAAGVSVMHADITLKSEDLKTVQNIDATVAANGITASGASVDELQLTAKGALAKTITLQLRGKGNLDKTPWDVQFAGQASQPNASTYSLKTEQLEGNFAKAPIRLAAPSTLTYSPTRSELTPFKLSLAQGTIEAQGVVARDTVKGAVSIQQLALDKLPLVALPKAILNADAALSGTATSPALTWKAGSTLPLEGRQVAITHEGSWKQATISTQTHINADKASADAQVTLPATLSLAPFATNIGEQTKLGGTVTAALPLSLLNTQLRATGQRIEGAIDGKATLLGTLGAPSFDGAFKLTDGRYDHTETGVCLRQMNATLTGNQQGIRLDSFRAIDSANHHFDINGQFALAGNHSLSGKASFDHFRLFCGGMLSGELDGGINLTGTPQAMSVAGKMVLGPLNVQIPGNKASSEIPTIESSWVKRGEVLKKDASASRIALDIQIDAPNQLFIRGRGLDAEFGGNLTIGGTATTPEIAGSFSKKRGKFVLLDRTMELQTATLLFEGPIPPSPFLNVVADTKVNGTTITSTLSGTAAKPKIELTSSPTLPQDELLAQLLFGRQLTQISPFQALRLAQATRELAGLDGGGPGILGTVRDKLGLDTLDVGTDTNNNVSVSTGKYISDKVYVGVNQGAKPEDRKVVTEITLTPSVSGKTSVDSVGNQGVGLEWKKDY